MPGAIFSFVDRSIGRADSAVHVYIHSDTLILPVKAGEYITSSREYAYGMPRFDPGESAAGFVRVTKGARGRVRILVGDWRDCAPHTASYRYEIYTESDKLMVDAYAIYFDMDADEWKCRGLYMGPHELFNGWATKERDEQ